MLFLTSKQNEPKKKEKEKEGGDNVRVVLPKEQQLATFE